MGRKADGDVKRAADGVEIGSSQGWLAVSTICAAMGTNAQAEPPLWTESTEESESGNGKAKAGWAVQKEAQTEGGETGGQ
ncbi:hypothetical protein LMH87_009643 [Akanthomyces muscarius]|uniref:Uncharacterized protein n=1 Tax=Akanthomyces muscarius TaxID=2231603 RepID=A0A9W8QBS3_AKAMU|nr:hypothetical protein LMH87_009643 [Akanthomyces muscarius]KAJ4153140.1 hypothetical protein LMH87_009643 [Akanthomyces muscarius]